MDIRVDRKGSDRVEIFADDRTYYLVSYSPTTNNWGVVRHNRGVVGYGLDIGTYASAEKAVSTVKAMLEDKGDELTNALANLL